MTSLRLALPIFLCACNSTTMSTSDIVDTFQDFQDSVDNLDDASQQPDAVAEFPAPGWLFQAIASSGFATAADSAATPGGVTFSMPALRRYKAFDTNAGTYDLAIDEVTLVIEHDPADDSWIVQFDGPKGAYSADIPKHSDGSWVQSANSTTALMGHPTILLSYYIGSYDSDNMTDGGTTKLTSRYFHPWSNGMYSEEEYTSILGFNTDPATISAMTGTADYAGYLSMDFNFDPNSGSDEVYASFNKETLNLKVDFDRAQLAGSVWMTPAVFHSGFTADDHVFLEIGPVPIEGGGFIAALKEDDWSKLGLSDADIRIVGAFYEDDAATLAGLVQGTVTSRDNSADGGNGTDGTMSGSVFGSFLTESQP